MAILKLEVPWEEVKYLLVEAEPLLSEEDVQYNIPGEEELLISHLATKMNRSEEHIKGWIESVSHTSGMAS